MKKSILLAAAFGLILAGTAQAQNSITGSFNTAAGEGIVGSKHDLSTASGVGGVYGASDTLDRICIWCHAPHHAMQEAEAENIKYLPLWNHGVTSAMYTLYESDFGDGPDASGATGVGQVGNNAQFADRHLFNGRASLGQPGSVSRLCLSCHDGTVAINEYGNDTQRANSQSSGGNMIEDQFKIGGAAGGSLGNLTNHHPIGFDYNEVANLDDEIKPSWNVVNGMAGTTGLTTIQSLLYGNNMECVTCHDVHNSKNQGETFLWVSDRESKFCLTCHDK